MLSRLEQNLQDKIEQIQPVSREHRDRCRAYWDQIGKPLHSLGRLEDAWAQIAGIRGTVKPKIESKQLIIMCADNGVVEEGVTQTGQEVTAIVAENFFDDRACTSLMCKEAGCDMVVVDIGMAADTPRTLKKKTVYGTSNFTKGPAMTKEQLLHAILTGIDLVREGAQAGVDLFATGEMGIGNTTTSSAIVAVLLGLPVELVTGRGAGLSSEGLERKIAAISRGIEINQPDPKDPADVLMKLGGLDIAGLTGVFLGGAIYRRPVLIDGFISAAAALAAVRFAPACRDYMLASHVSKEPAAVRLLEALDKKPFLTCEMCLGEGSGAVAAMPLLDMAARVYNQMGTFEDIQVERYLPLA